MKIKKFLLSLAAVAVIFNLAPKSHAEVISSVDWEIKIRDERFVSVYYNPNASEVAKKRSLEKIGKKLSSLPNLKEISVESVKDFLREESYNESNRWRECSDPEILAVLRTMGQDGTYGDAAEFELRYIALISETVDEVLENLKNMTEAYTRVCEHYIGFPQWLVIRSKLISAKV